MYKLAGYLVCYGLTKKDGSVVEHRLDTPIHNTITKYMLNNLLQFNGNQSLTNNTEDFWSLFVRVDTPNVRTGVINYGAFGDGTGETDTNDRTLKSIKSEYSDTRKNGTFYNGNYADNGTKIFKIRCSYSFNPVNEDITVREVGTFHKVEPDGDINMTSRVVLDNPIDLESGDEFYFVYELNVSFSAEELIELPTINKFLRKNFALGLDTGSWTISQHAFPSIKSDGRAVLYGMTSTMASNFYYYNCFIKFPIFSSIEGLYAGEVALGTRFAYPVLSSGGNMGGSFGGAYRNSTSYQSALHSTIRVDDYVMDSFKRTYTISLDPEWCNDTDVWAFYLNGECYQFGDYSDGVFTPSPWHKPADSSVYLCLQQSWSTDLLQPTV